MVQKVYKTIMEKQLIKPGEQVVLGVSGGADSVALLMVLYELRESLELSLHVVHVNHGLRQEAIQEQQYVEALCKELQVPCYVFSRDIYAYSREQRCSVEEAGRIYRYQCFYDIHQKVGGGRIAVAHHGNDRIETMLFQIARGSGLKGAAGIPVCRDEIIRPMLYVTRREIEEFLRQRDIVYYEDATNAQLIYTRNRVRHEIIPELELINERAIQHFLAFGDMAREYWEYVEAEAQEAGKKSIRADEYGVHIFLEELQGVPELLLRHLCYNALEQCCGQRKDISYTHVEHIYALFSQQVGKEVALPYGCKAVREYQQITLKASVKEQPKPEGIVLASIQEPIRIKPGETKEISVEYQVKMSPVKIEPMPEISKKVYTKMLDYGKIFGVLCIRNPQEGDYLVINRQGNHKSLSRFLLENKVPQEFRREVVILASGSRILWIMGMRLSADCILDEETTEWIEVEVLHKGD